MRFPLAVLVMLSFAAACQARDLPVQDIRVPDGFSVGVFAREVPGARSMTLGDRGTLFVGTRDAGKIYALPDRDGDGRADRMITLATGLNMPNGVAYRDGALYVAEIHRVLRFDDIEARLDKAPKPVVVYDQLPRDTHHGWRFIRFGPDGQLYIPIGVPCNVCDEPGYGLITRMPPAGGKPEVYARGVRNSVGFDWHPETGELWFTDNGRDWLGDDQPPDELNHAPRAGMHFGFPYCHGGDLPDPEFGDREPCDRFVAPALKLGPHVAALGMRFYTGGMFPPQYRNRIFIAEHGSWNRSRKIGYRVGMVTVDGGRATEYQVFAEGWLRGEQVWGRPVDVQVMPDGALLVSDDRADAIYRITYRRP